MDVVSRLFYFIESFDLAFPWLQFAPVGDINCPSALYCTYEYRFFFQFSEYE